MTNKIYLLTILTLLFTIFWPVPGLAAPVDSNASAETRALLRRLQDIRGRQMLFGHQNTDLEGVGWKLRGVSDVYQVTGRYPSVFGYDVEQIRDPAFTASELREKIIRAHELGAVITFSWHQRNPKTNGKYSDLTPAVREILDQGPAYLNFIKDLDLAAEFFKSLKDKNGKLIPILFRPLHEGNGKWFWWGLSRADEYVALWRFYVRYMSLEKRVDNLLYVYSPAIRFYRLGSFWDRYPGDRWVDVLGYEQYLWESWLWFEAPILMRNLRGLVLEGERRNKVVAITEIGISGGRIPANFWTRYFLGPIVSDALARKVAYSMFWRNDSVDHYFVPYPGEASERDFREMADSPFLKFAD